LSQQTHQQAHCPACQPSYIRTSTNRNKVRSFSLIDNVFPSTLYIYLFFFFILLSPFLSDDLLGALNKAYSFVSHSIGAEKTWGRASWEAAPRRNWIQEEEWWRLQGKI
jgi:hypothetical protein